MAATASEANGRPSTASTSAGPQEMDGGPVPQPVEAPANDAPAELASATDAPAPRAAVVDTKALDNVLYSDIGISTLLTRLKQSIASAKDFAAFLKERSGLEEKHSAGLRKISKSAADNAAGADNRQGSYARQFKDAMRAHERMADHGAQFAASLHTMHEELTDLHTNMERGRKQWKHEGLDNEKKVKDAENLMDKAKARYSSLAEQYDKARTGDASGRVFGLKGPKSAEQREEDLLRKTQAADQEYAAKVEAARSSRQENLSTHRPNAIRALQDLIIECDAALTLQLQKFSALNEKLIVSNGLTVSPMRGDEALSGPPSMREMVGTIDNTKDHHDFILSYAGSVPRPPPEIKYEKHPSLLPHSPPASRSQPPAAASSAGPTAAATSAAPVSSVSAGPPTISLNTAMQASGPATTPMSPPSTANVTTPNAANQNHAARAAPSSSAITFSPSAPGANPAFSQQPPAAQSFNSPPQNASYGPYRSPGATQQMPYTKAPPQPSNMPQKGPDGGNLPSYNPVFGMNLDALFRRDESAVPLVVYQCIQAVDLFGLEVEGIYRLNGNSSHIQKLRAAFDHDSHRVDFRNPENFFHDVNSVAGLLKTFFREMPDPLLTAEHYSDMIQFAKIDDADLRRDKLHGIINSLPDPNYATLRALVLHLHRVQERSGVNRMSTANLSICFAPTLMGQHQGHMADAGLQARVLDTILSNTYQIFDDD